MFVFVFALRVTGLTRVALQRAGSAHHSSVDPISLSDCARLQAFLWMPRPPPLSPYFVATLLVSLQLDQCVLWSSRQLGLHVRFMTLTRFLFSLIFSLLRSVRWRDRRRGGGSHGHVHCRRDCRGARRRICAAHVAEEHCVTLLVESLR